MTDKKFTDEEIRKAFDILDKFEFFGGQRAARELWFNKPTDIQNKDIGGFLRDLDFLKQFINRQRAEIERYEKTVGKLAVSKDGIVTGVLNGKETEYIQKSAADVFRNMAVNRAKAEIVQELQKLKEKAYTNNYCQEIVLKDEIDNIIKEMENKTNE